LEYAKRLSVQPLKNSSKSVAGHTGEATHEAAIKFQKRFSNFEIISKDHIRMVADAEACGSVLALPDQLTGFVLDQILLFLSQSHPTNLDVIGTPPLIAVLIWLGVTDWRSFRLPDAGTLPLIISGLMLAVWRDGSVPIDQMIGAVTGFAFFWAIGAAYFRARGIDALGLGDAKLLAAAGAWLGWQALPSIILIASIAGIAVALVRGGGPSQNIPFGPSLAGAFFLHWALFLSGWV